MNAPSLEPQNKPIKKIGLFLKHRSKEVQGECRRVIKIAQRLGCHLSIAQTDGAIRFPGIPLLPAHKIGNKVDCILVLGGDGTMLYAARLVAPTSQTPIIGIHLGHLGFMTQIQMDQVEEALQRMMEGRYRIKDRMTLSVEITSKKRAPFKGLCVNELVVHRGNIARIIDLRVKVKDMLLSTIRGDGVIVSTPLGSTAYSLSAGGPITHPACPTLTITPLCPHTLTHRPVVIPANYSISIEATNPKQVQALKLTLDGQVERDVASTDKIRVKHSPTVVKLIDLNTPGRFFETLREKLHWGI